MTSYGIGEVCRLLGIRPHVLRYWETVVDLLEPKKSESGRREYSDHDLNVLFRLRHLTARHKLSIEAAGRLLWEEATRGDANIAAALGALRTGLIRLHAAAARVTEAVNAGGSSPASPPVLADPGGGRPSRALRLPDLVSVAPPPVLAAAEAVTAIINGLRIEEPGGQAIPSARVASLDEVARPPAGMGPPRRGVDGSLLLGEESDAAECTRRNLVYLIPLASPTRESAALLGFLQTLRAWSLLSGTVPAVRIVVPAGSAGRLVERLGTGPASMVDVVEAGPSLVLARRDGLIPLVDALERPVVLADGEVLVGMTAISFDNTTLVYRPRVFDGGIEAPRSDLIRAFDTLRPDGPLLVSRRYRDELQRLTGTYLVAGRRADASFFRRVLCRRVGKGRADDKGGLKIIASVDEDLEGSLEIEYLRSRANRRCDETALVLEAGDSPVIRTEVPP